MNDLTQPHSTFKFHGRSYFALALRPEKPIVKWLGEVDKWIERSPGFFAGKPVVIDVSGESLAKLEFEQLMCGLRIRDIRILGVEGANPSWLGDGITPLLTRATSTASCESAQSADSLPSTSAETPAPSSMLIEGPVRSGQSILFPSGDVTVIGSVASGAEVIAGGSIHIYGALRGRAIAGLGENPGARIFCHRLEAELVAINGYYSTAEELEPRLFRNSVQAWLDHDTVRLSALA